MIEAQKRKPAPSAPWAAAARVLAVMVLLAGVAGCKARPGAPQEMDVTEHLYLGMTLAQAQDVLRRQTGDPEADFINDVCCIPLGLDFHDGARIWTLDSNVRISKALDWPALYFYGGKLFAIRYSLTEAELETLALRYPNGRFLHHDFPDERISRKIFVAADEDQYVFTNRHGDLYVMDEEARQAIMSGVVGSYCWYAKLFSPNLRKFIGNYTACLAAQDQIPVELLEADLEGCYRYCRNTPNLYASEDCLSICQEAVDKGRDVVRAREALSAGQGSEEAAEEGADEGGEEGME